MVTLVLGKGGDYSSHFAQLLEKEGGKTLIIDLDFSKEPKEKNPSGLIHYLRGEIEEPPLEKKPYGAFIPMGGASPFGDELLKSKQFYRFIDEVKHQYDVTLLPLTKRASDSLPQHFFSCSDLMVVKLTEESFTQLLPYFEWDDGKGAALFLS